MKKSLIIIFIIILVIHLAMLLFLTLQNDSEDSSATPSPEPPESTPELLPEPVIDHKKIPVTHKKKNTSTSPKPKHSSKNTSTHSPVLKTKLNYSQAVQGNIRTIPECKKIKAGILVDADTGKVLWAKNSRTPVRIASMTKIMTLLLIFEDIKNGKISLSDNIKVTRKAAATGKSKIWLDPRENFSLAQLLKATAIRSANDAAYLIAEYNGGGDISHFIKKMNTRAKKMGLKTARFYNPHGLPNKKKKGKDNVCSCEELVFIAENLIRFPEALKLSSTKVAYLPRQIGKTKKTMLINTNNLVRKNFPGVDGLKTGYTNKAGFCITVTCKRKGKRLIAIITGSPSSKHRDAFAKKLINWGYKSLK